MSSSRSPSQPSPSSDGMRKSRSFNDLILGPTQRAHLDPATSSPPPPAAAAASKTPSSGGQVQKKSKTKSAGGGVSYYWVYAVVAFSVACGVLFSFNRLLFDEFVAAFVDSATFERLPVSAQDNVSAVCWTLLSIPVILVLDLLLCYPLSKNHFARWYFLHASTNAIIAVLAVPDIYYTLVAPHRGADVSYCSELGSFPACSDLPTCFILGLHLYHVLFFELGPGDIFHHLLFVPLVGLAHFVVPCGASANILCFFISGFPGAMDYLMLGLVKNGSMKPITEKRINCSINTWIRAPGITISCAMTWVGWVCLENQQSYFPAPVLWLLLALIYYNGQFYAQRVVGNYFIWKAVQAEKEGRRAALHPS